ncbi:MerR family transcriptional regulator [Nocardioides perillae]|uniref:Methanogenic corrinoid protein MtbC1 n=1 Tax=Nocardioides perillae TaxID=1119534 RepID=A0A7Y9UKR3_9ACTN|nr:methanogenic corrinoid protein MtbC1 [Nocardioides perillae]
MSTGPAVGLRIGALAERVGASETVLRVWERRYGLFSPTRTAGGYRLYGPDDERRARAMVEAREQGVPAAQAAAAILAAERRVGARPDAGEPGTDAGPAGDALATAPTAATAASAAGWVADLLAATARLDHVASHQVVDRALASASVEVVVRDVLLPFLAEVGTGWEEGSVSIEQEHFASDLVRGRLTTLGSGLGAGTGPLVLLACPPGERHDLGLKAFELVALRAGCRTRYLGADTPLASVEAAAARTEPDLVVLSATRAEVLSGVADELRDLAGRHPLALAGAGATPEIAEQVGATLVSGDPVTAARHLRALRPGGRRVAEEGDRG